MRCHLREGIYGTGDFHLLHQSSAVPADLRVFPSVSGRKFPYGEIFCRKNAPNARVTDGKIDSEGENCDRRSACATRKRTVREPPFHAVPRHETTFLSGCGEGSPAPSALHMRVVLPISTSAGIASFPTADHPVTFLSSSSKSTPPYKLHESPGTLPVSNPISAPSATSRIAVLISYP